MDAVRVERPGEHNEPQETPALPGYFDARIPADIIDRTRREARERVYANSTVERETIIATDEAVFDRVRASERFQIEEAERLLARNQNRVADSLAYIDKLNDLRDRLRQGGDTTAIAKEYKNLERAIRQRETSVLRGLAAQADRVDAALEDPIAHAQRILSLMPFKNWQPLRVKR